jgi:hypothetical protein
MSVSSLVLDDWFRLAVMDGLLKNSAGVIGAMMCCDIVGMRFDFIVRKYVSCEELTAGGADSEIAGDNLKVKGKESEIKKRTTDDGRGERHKAE